MTWSVFLAQSRKAFLAGFAAFVPAFLAVFTGQDTSPTPEVVDVLRTAAEAFGVGGVYGGVVGVGTWLIRNRPWA